MVFTIALTSFSAISSASSTPTPTPGCADDTWTATSLINAPTARVGHTAVWTGSEMIVWGGYDLHNYLNTGGRYDPATNTWRATSTTNAPTGRWFHTAVWTGSEMIVWDGSGQPGLFSSGGRYNPATDTWTPMSTTNAPSRRSYHTAVWTGREMIVWGGSGLDGLLNTGGRYNPSTDSWIPTTTTSAPAGRVLNPAIWTGIEMIVWGGAAGDNIHLDYDTGGKYNPDTDSWVATTLDNAPSPRRVHTAVWTGSEMIVWGGNSQIFFYYDGGRYDPVADTWTPTSIPSTLLASVNHLAVWTGSEMIVWGGGVNVVNTGARYNPVTGNWIPTTVTNAPAGRDFRASRSVWTGNTLIVWGGGRFGSSEVLNTGGIYCAPPSNITISGATFSCSKPVPVPLASVTLTLTGSASGTVLSDGSGNYQVSAFPVSGTFSVTPSKNSIAPGFAGIDTVDALATQRHFLDMVVLPPGCRLSAADVNSDGNVNTVDAIAIQRFFLARSTGLANVGKFRFSPGNRTYSGVLTDQTDQNYDALVFGDVVSPFVKP